MAVNRPYVMYKLLKVKIDMGHGGSEGRILAYVLFDNKGIRLCHGRLTEPDEEGMPHGIKSKWREFCSFVDEIRSGDLEEEEDETEEARGENQEIPSEDLEFSVMMKELRKSLDEAGVYDLSEGNLVKIRYVEKIFHKVAGLIYTGDRFVFLKIETLSHLEGEELMSAFPEERAENEPWRPGSSGGSSGGDGKNLPKAVFSCSVMLDPVAGVAASELKPGQSVWLDIPEESLLYSIAKFQQGPSFQGQIVGEVMSVEQSDTERIMILFKLSDELRAVSIVQQSLKVKRAADKEVERAFSFPEITKEQGLALVGVAFFMVVLLLLLILR
ncbi:hypothetical protein Dpep_1164 [Dethiosulfovibrio peptidovorans DSM 11002]|uniref:Uncharacterized protein n=1 Tax=Dethiosulfovibrio peptidovorans DSM 11002 TaxID=469381 RepID=D2Z6U3_9BACT|nr:hypothetical protein [Dethiosulfovibrio peptidovorans]EFC91190.1 hypothetical protein Dpep_1164 [Dethiosulfovibrio peptidovorans DSM 11002]